MHMSEKQQNMDELKLSDFLFSTQVSLWQRQLFSLFVVMDSSVTLKICLTTINPA